MHIIVSAGNDDQNQVWDKFDKLDDSNLRLQCFGGPAILEDQRVKDVGQLVIGMTDYNDHRVSILPNELGSNFGNVSSRSMDCGVQFVVLRFHSA
jgi:hypothetical protein